jgi:hypothetical protein
MDAALMLLQVHGWGSHAVSTGALMIIAALIGVAFLVFGSGGTYGGLPGSVCVTNPGTEYGGDWSTSAVTARPGHSRTQRSAANARAD